MKRNSNGDLVIMMIDTSLQWVFNPECVELVERAKPHSYKTGQIVRFKNIPTEQMKKLQEESKTGWVPLLQDVGPDFIIKMRNVYYRLKSAIIQGSPQ